MHFISEKSLMDKINTNVATLKFDTVYVEIFAVY